MMSTIQLILVARSNTVIGYGNGQPATGEQKATRFRDGGEISRRCRPIKVHVNRVSKSIPEICRQHWRRARGIGEHAERERASRCGRSIWGTQCRSVQTNVEA